MHFNPHRQGFTQSWLPWVTVMLPLFKLLQPLYRKHWLLPFCSENGPPTGTLQDCLYYCGACSFGLLMSQEDTRLGQPWFRDSIISTDGHKRPNELKSYGESLFCIRECLTHWKVRVSSAQVHSLFSTEQSRSCGTSCSVLIIFPHCGARVCAEQIIMQGHFVKNNVIFCHIGAHSSDTL